VNLEGIEGKVTIKADYTGKITHQSKQREHLQLKVSGL